MRFPYKLFRHNLFLFSLLLFLSNCSERNGVGSKNEGIRSSIVRVVTPSAAGTGFFISDSLGQIFVVTNFHVIDDGGRIELERSVPISDSISYVEAYPEVSVVCFDRKADLALLKVHHLPAEKMPPLSIGNPQRDIDITSWGYPASSLVIDRSLGLTSKKGRVSNFDKLPYYDKITGEILQEDAISALIVSTDIEPGFSGGPTVNERGEVVGVNVRKDLKHAGQNGVIHINEVSKLMKKIPQPTLPNEQQVEGFIKTVQDEYLSLAFSERTGASELEFIHLGDRPRLRSFFLESEDIYGRKMGVLGIMFCALPGKKFESWLNANTRSAVKECEQYYQQFEQFFGEQEISDAKAGCKNEAYRLFAWDLISSTLRWEGKKRRCKVSGIECISTEKQVHKARVNPNKGQAFPLYFTTDGGELKLKLFDLNGTLVALNSSLNFLAEDYLGAWERKVSLTQANQTIFVEESLQLYNREDGLIRIIYSQDVETDLDLIATLSQEFIGEVAQGQILAEPAQTIQYSGPLEVLNYTEPEVIRLKIVGDELMMYRTNGENWPETLEFKKLRN